LRRSLSNLIEGDDKVQIKIIDFMGFQKDNGMYFSNSEIKNDILDVYAISGRTKKSVLLFIEKTTLSFCNLNRKYIQVLDDDIPESWVYRKKFKYNGKTNDDTPDLVTLKLNELFAPSWMISDDFLYNIFMNPDKAKRVFINNLNR